MRLLKWLTRWIEGPPPTGRTLQERYPPGPGAFVTHYSSIDLPEEAFVAQPRHYCEAVADARQQFRGEVELTLRELRDTTASFEAAIGEVGPAVAFQAWCRQSSERLLEVSTRRDTGQERR